MDMGALNIGMLENDIGLVAIPHALHILLRHFHELPIADPIRRIRVQRYVAHRLFRFDICGQIRLKTLVQVSGRIGIIQRFGYSVQQQETL